jgi:Mrp family chromosome partitioning ATPase
MNPFHRADPGHWDGAIIVTTPQDIAILDVKKSVDFAHKLNLKISV